MTAILGWFGVGSTAVVSTEEPKKAKPQPLPANIVNKHKIEQLRSDGLVNVHWKGRRCVKDPETGKVPHYAFTQACEIRRQEITEMWDFFANECADPVYNQNNEYVGTALAHIKKNGANLNSMVLTDVNDDLLEAIASCCPNLTSLTINQRIDTIMMGATDKGLKALETLQKLESLNLNVWDAQNFSSEGLNALLSSDSLQKTVKQLAISSPAVSEHTIEIISKYPLENLKIAACGDSTLDNGVKSSCLAAQVPKMKTLKSLDIDLVAGAAGNFEDDFIEALSKQTNLTSLVLKSDWKITPKAVTAMLAGLPNLTELALIGCPMQREHAKPIAEIKNLQHLTLSDSTAFYPEDFKMILEAQQNLESLSLGKCYYLDNFDSITTMSKLKSLGLDYSCSLYCDLHKIGDSPALQKSLETFYLFNANNETDSEAYASLGKLQLKALRLENCVRFNDISMRGIFEHKTPLTTYLQALELSNVSITNQTTGVLGRCQSLSALMLSDCYALTNKGVDMMLRSPLKERVSKLYLNTLPISEEVLKTIGKLPMLDTFFINNDDKWCNENIKPRLPNIGVTNGRLINSIGEPLSYEQFINN